MLMFKAYYMLLPMNLQTLFTKIKYIEGNMATRQINTFYLPRARTTLKSMCVTINGVKLWNSLNQEIIKEYKTLHKFRRSIKTMLLERYIK